MLPAFEQGSQDVALVELGVSSQRGHPAGRICRRHQTIETGGIAASRVGQISIEAARRIA
jgi:hypothetical protein